LATSLGFGAQQAGAGLNFLFGIEKAPSVCRFLLSSAVTSVAVVSVVRGLEGGVKVLSNFNMLLAVILLCFVIMAGSFIPLHRRLLQNGHWRICRILFP
jgi:BCCT family betaine/carnitine transporter